MPAATLLVSRTAAAETLLEYSKKTDSPSLYIKGDWESSAECEQRVASGTGSTQSTDSKAAGMMAVGKDCRTSCKNWPAPEGHKWFGTAPSCTGKKMNKNKQAYKDCVAPGGRGGRLELLRRWQAVRNRQQDPLQDANDRGPHLDGGV